MALVPSALASAMLAAVAPSVTAVDAMAKLGVAISTYLLANTQFMFSWVGINPGPPPVPDPVVVGTGMFVSLVINLTPSAAMDPVTAMTVLATQIKAGMSAATITMAPPFVGAPIPIASAPTLSSLVLTPSAAIAAPAAHTFLATQIILWVKTLIPTVPWLGANGPFLAPPGAGGLVTSVL